MSDRPWPELCAGPKKAPQVLRSLFKGPSGGISTPRGLPSSERRLRRVLAERLPGAPGQREDQAERLAGHLRRVRPGKAPEAPLVKAAELRLERLRAPVEVPADIGLAQQERGSGRAAHVELRGSRWHVMAMGSHAWWLG